VSTGAAIAGTTQLLRMALQNFLPDLSGPLGGQPTVSALPPDRITTGNAEPVQLNIFLYRTEVNPAWRNVSLPSRSVSGERLSQPVLGLNLHYLVSAYAKQDLHADVLLGHAMEVLHGLTGLTSAMVAQRFAGAAPPDVTGALWQLLKSSSLDRQAEQLTVSLEPQSIDDISKLWSVLGEKYRPSAAYLVSVVLIEPTGPTTAPLPVTETPHSAVAVRARPALAGVSPSVLPYAEGATLILEGTGLLGTNTTVLLGDVPRQPEAGASASRLAVHLPAGLAAGVMPLRLRHSVAVGTTEKDFEYSNALSLTVRPVPGAATVVPAGGGVPRRIRVPVTPAVAAGQDVRLLLNRVGARASVTLAVEPVSAPATSLDFPLPTTFTAGTYLYRLSIDDASSELERNPSGAFVTPRVVVP
jgi:hypothetical protein